MKAQIYLFFLIICYCCCQNRKSIDVSHIPVDIHIERFDRELASLDVDNMREKNTLWHRQYGQFYVDFMQYMLSAGNINDTTALYQNLGEITASEDFKELSKEIAKIFPDLDSQDKGLTNAFKRIKYYFPQAKIPRFIAFFSGFGVQSPINEEYIGIGLDMFLGADSKFYPAISSSTPRYVSQKFTPENIVPRCTEVFLREELFPETVNLVTMLDHMVYNGKVMYLMDNMLPQVPDSLKIGYTAKQMAWTQQYQREIWTWMVKEQMLYSPDYASLRKHFDDAPFTAELGEPGESAPKLGVYIGWQIVRQYMDKNTDASLQDMLAMPAQTILNGAKYKGKYQSK
ncbi:hypothetical protein [Olivibacter sitiensis]|uniref:gliding motility lipoprotein GldB n=1 Tax=Olivibacter sitiensis TaxID=376470 RepID=UPI000480BDF3|nr:hypothetical protein [Olivibacter sitiensis]